MEIIWVNIILLSFTCLRIRNLGLWGNWFKWSEVKLKFFGTPSGKTVIPCVVVDCLELWGWMVGVIMGRNSLSCQNFRDKDIFCFWGYTLMGLKESCLVMAINRNSLPKYGNMWLFPSKYESFCIFPRPPKGHCTICIEFFFVAIVWKFATYKVLKWESTQNANIWNLVQIASLSCSFCERLFTKKMIYH